MYVHAIITKGQDYWNVDSGEDLEPGLDFVFPSSPAYTISTPAAIPKTNGIPTVDLITMGSSAPISIVLPKNHNSTFSKSFAGYKPQRQAEPQNHDCYRFLLKRHGELLKGIKLMMDGKISESEILLKKQSRHEILPRFGLELLQVDYFLIIGSNA
jgi:hypothetical protein